MKNPKNLFIIYLVIGLIGGYIYLSTNDYRLIAKILLGISTVAFFMTIYYFVKMKNK
jgi:hypothetical protein